MVESEQIDTDLTKDIVLFFLQAFAGSRAKEQTQLNYFKD